MCSRKQARSGRGRASSCTVGGSFARQRSMHQRTGRMPAPTFPTAPARPDDGRERLCGRATRKGRAPPASRRERWRRKTGRSDNRRESLRLFGRHVGDGSRHALRSRGSRRGRAGAVRVATLVSAGDAKVEDLTCRRGPRRRFRAEVLVTKPFPWTARARRRSGLRCGGHAGREGPAPGRGEGLALEQLGDA